MGFKEVLGIQKNVHDVEIVSVDSENQTKLELEEYKDKFPEPTEEEYLTLPKATTTAPLITYFVCLIEFAERASYYGVSGRLYNFIQLPLPEGGNGAGAPPSGTQKNAGALGLGLETASAITLLLTFLAYTTPLWGGYISDKSWGRVRTIWYGIWVGAIAHIVLVVAGIPSVISDGKALAPTIIAILLLALATGMIKPNLLPLLLDQYPHRTDVVETLEDGSRRILLRSESLTKVTAAFYWAINVGAFMSLATSYCAKRVGFWLAFLIPCIIYIIMIPVLILLTPKLKKETPNGISVLGETLKVLRYAFKPGWVKRWKQQTFWDYAKPTNLVSGGLVSSIDETNKKGIKKLTWDDKFVDDVKTTLRACRIFFFYIIYVVNDGGLGGIQNSQANSLSTNGVPNDLFNNFNPLTIIVFIPILNYIIYPLAARFFVFTPVRRIFTGFMLAAISQAVGAIIQWRVYQTSPCGYHATDCQIGTGVSPISAWVEVTLYILQASSECFSMTAGYEVAYARAPEHMKGLVMAVFLFTGNALAAALSQALTPVLEDPYLIWPFVAFSVAGTFIALLFLWVYRDLHIIMEQERLDKEALLETQASKE